MVGRLAQLRAFCRLLSFREFMEEAVHLIQLDGQFKDHVPKVTKGVKGLRQSQRDLPARGFHFLEA